jgi:FrmR/RcnR family transcriptional regulator, repressor of rcnA expression
MSFSLTEKTDLLQRIRRIDSQIRGVERAIDQEWGCAHLLHLISAARSSIDSFLVDVIGHHLRSHLAEEGAESNEAIEETIKMAELYLR